jgi:hypothetical protein
MQNGNPAYHTPPAGLATIAKMLKQYLISKIDPKEYYKKRFPRWNDKRKDNILCPFHKDKTPSFSVALINGGARCHGSSCGRSIANIVHMEAELTKQAEHIVARRLYREFIRPVISKKTVKEYRDALATNTVYILKIKKEMGLSLKEVLHFRLGYDEKSNRITIPIYDQFDQCVNVRFYQLPSDRKGTKLPKIYNLEGYGAASLFPYPDISNDKINDPIYIMASEKEAMLARMDGLPAVCSTAGEGSWSADWNRHIEGRTVYLVMDTDRGGRSASKKLQEQFATVANGVHVVTLKFKTKRPDWKDYADWRLRDKNKPDQLNKILSTGKKLSQPEAQLTLVEPAIKQRKRKLPRPELPNYATFIIQDVGAISSNPKFLNTRIRTQAIVSSKAQNTYSIPWRFNVTSSSMPTVEIKVPYGRELLRFVRSSDAQIAAIVCGLAGYENASVVGTAHITATELEIIPTAVVDKDIPYVVQRSFYIGKRIESNVPYVLDVIPTTDMRTQETVGIITSAKPLAKSIEKFDFSENNTFDLTFFRPDSGQSAWEKLASVADEIAYRYAKVYNRRDWIICALLTWASPIGFYVPTESELQRGWLNTLALGDTETGKSKVAKKLKEIFKCGVFVNGENCTFAGLIGGAITNGSRQFMLRWGRIPLSDKQLVILEELSGLSVEEISNMSDVRSSGMARLDKGGINAETNARTRLLCLSNSRSERHGLNGYLYGIHAVHQLIGHGEDIARFDLITTLVDSDVSNDVINSNQLATDAKEANNISEDQLQKLIHFIWALTPSQINISQETYDTCLRETKRLASIYHPDIPVFKGGSGRFKLARIGTAIACFQFSWDGRNINVLPEHIVAAAKLLTNLYDRRSFGYLEYSKQMYDRARIKNGIQIKKTLRQKIPKKGRRAEVIEALIHATKFSREELQAIASVPNTHAEIIIGVLFRCRALRKGEGLLWEVTPVGKTFLEDYAKTLQ